MDLFKAFNDELEKISGVQRIRRLEKALDKARLARGLEEHVPVRERLLERALTAARRKHARRVTGDTRDRLGYAAKDSITPKSPIGSLGMPTDLSAMLGVPQIGEALRKRRIDRYYARADKAFLEGGFKQHRRRMDAPRPAWRKKRDMKKLTNKG